jgi:hypothetical protein
MRRSATIRLYRDVVPHRGRAPLEAVALDAVDARLAIIGARTRDVVRKVPPN